ncbi:MAG: hypothetical protein NTX42_09015 [Methanothrix sp.]|nr:hypothetical protein [Methanothrix sp.]
MSLEAGQVAEIAGRDHRPCLCKAVLSGRAPTSPRARAGLGARARGHEGGFQALEMSTDWSLGCVLLRYAGEQAVIVRV